MATQEKKIGKIFALYQVHYQIEGLHVTAHNCGSDLEVKSVDFTWVIQK